MKKMVLALIAAMTMATSMMAQDDNQQNRERRQFDPVEMMKQRTEQMVKDYGLNEEQAKQLAELNTQFAGKMRQGRGFRPGGDRGPRPGGDRGQRPGRRERMNTPQPDSAKVSAERPALNGFERMREAREAYDKELQKIMTEEQYNAYKADEAKRMNRGPRRR